MTCMSEIRLRAALWGSMGLIPEAPPDAVDKVIESATKTDIKAIKEDDLGRNGPNNANNLLNLSRMLIVPCFFVCRNIVYPYVQL